jgi:hypothetical protein
MSERSIAGESNGEPGGNRTLNPQIKSLLLCQLSYRPQRRAIGRNETTILSSAGVFRPLSGSPEAPTAPFGAVTPTGLAGRRF